jgi:hypothetical protein
MQSTHDPLHVSVFFAFQKSLTFWLQPEATFAVSVAIFLYMAATFQYNFYFLLLRRMYH